MDLEKLEKLIALMRDSGVSYLETGDTKIVLRPSPTVPASAAPREEDNAGPEKKRLTGLGSSYDHPSLGLAGKLVS